MELLDLLLLVVVGAFSGLVSGLFGVGGGTVLVPALAIALVGFGAPDDKVLQFAIGTSFCIIAINSLIAARAHLKRGAGSVAVAKWVIPLVSIGVIAGTWIAVRMPSSALLLIFSIFLFLIALQMGSGWQPHSDVAAPNDKMNFGGAGAATIIGFVSAFFGIAGGSMLVPWLTMRGFSAHQAVATSSLSGIGLSLLGALSYGFAVAPQLNLGPQLGFVLAGAVAIAVVLSYPFTQLGVALAHRLSAKLLKRIFAIYLLLVIAVLNGVI